MNQREQNLIQRLTEKCHLEDIKVSRRSAREYDLTLEGRYGEDAPYMGGCAFSAWLPLMAIRELTNWTDVKIAVLTDHPEMTIEGDWSGVRDTNTDRIWYIFNKFV